MATTKKTAAKKTKTTRKTTVRAKTPATRAKKAKAAPAAEKPGDEVKINRRAAKDRRATTERRKKSEPVKVERRTIERRAKVNRRRQIDPTTCERDYSPEEVEFMNALEEYKRNSGRMFPTCSEILEVIRDLGYRRPTDEPVAESPSEENQPELTAPEPPLAAPDQADPLMVHQSLIM